MLVFLLMASKLIMSEGRVFCQDSYAEPWKPLGYSCPVTCNAVVTAVNRLKLYDYNRLLNERVRVNLNISDMELITIGKHLKYNALISRKSNRNTKLNKYITIAYQMLFKNETFVEYFKSELNKMAADFENGTCHKMAARKLFKKINLQQKCTRRMYNSQQILKRVTNILNKYSDTKYQFDENMTEMLLEKLLGNLDLRHGVLDMRRIIYYLQKALRYHVTHQKKRVIITLKSKHCMSIKISGCFCRSGYVENSGQCVKPLDCLSNPLYKEYLERVVIA